MNLKWYWGVILFFAVPLFLWLIGVLATNRKGAVSKLFAFVGGSDNRLSLSRLQAFAWTLVIFGSFVAAMAIHPLITSATKEQLNKAESNLKTGDETLVIMKAAKDKAAADLQAAINEENSAKILAGQAKIKADLSPEDTALKDAAVAAAKTQAEREKGRELYKNTKVEADKSYQETESARQAALDNSVKYNWVIIPAELLALAGIAIGSGIFSSLISNVNSEDKTACILSLSWNTGANISTGNPGTTNLETGKDYLVIKGTGFGKEGRVRLRAKDNPFVQVASTPYWHSDGNLIVADVPSNAEYNFLVVDTPNGKLSHEVKIQKADPSITPPIAPQPYLGEYKIRYEFADLFRDDKNPIGFDLMKFQMFGWTVIAIVIYSILFLTEVWNSEKMSIQTLPLVPASIVVLTGLSQAGYLASKAIPTNKKPGEN